MKPMLYYSATFTTFVIEIQENTELLCSLKIISDYSLKSSAKK